MQPHTHTLLLSLRKFEVSAELNRAYCLEATITGSAPNLGSMGIDVRQQLLMVNDSVK